MDILPFEILFEKNSNALKNEADVIVLFIHSNLMKNGFFLYDGQQVRNDSSHSHPHIPFMLEGIHF